MIKKLLNLSFLFGKLNLKAERKMIDSIVKEAASKFKKLIDMGFSDDLAHKIDDIAGGLSLWLAHEIIKDMTNLLDASNEFTGVNSKIEKKDIIKYIEEDFENKYRQNLIQIIDWVSVGLNGEYKPYKGYSWSDLINESRIWHEGLKESDGDIDYEEGGKIIIDFRDRNGIGFYWVDLETSSCSEEAERMGHCGRSGQGSNLFSLRKNVKINKKNVKNKSVLTAAINDDGMITQLKGAKNSKPKEEYHKYIAELLLFEKDGIKAVNGFKSEYQSETDFNLADIKDDDLLKRILKENPNLAYQLSTKVILALRLKDKSLNQQFAGEITPSKDFFRKIVSRYGNSLGPDSIYKIYNGEYDTYDWLSNHIVSFSEFINLYEKEINNKNKEKILELMKDINQNRDDLEEVLKELSNINVDNLVEHLKSDYHNFDLLKNAGVIRAVSQALDSTNVDSQFSEVSKEINNFLANFGDTKEYGKIKVNFLKLVKEAIDATGDEDQIFAILNELEYNDIEDAAIEFIEKCYDEDIFDDKLSIDVDNIYSRFDEVLFNEILQEQLADLY